MNPGDKFDIKEVQPEHEQICIGYNEDGSSMRVKWWSPDDLPGMWTYPSCDLTTGIYYPLGLGEVKYWLPEKGE